MKKILVMFLFIFSHQAMIAETLDIQTAEDLHLNSKKKGSLIDKLGLTQTKAGRLALDKLFSQPESSIETILSRQDFIKELANKPELRAQLQNSLASYTLNEKALDQFVNASKRGNLYWSWKSLNSRFALSMYHSMPVEMATSIGHLALTSLILWHQGQAPSVSNFTCGPSCSHTSHQFCQPCGGHSHDHGHSHRHNHGHSHGHSNRSRISLGWGIIYGAAFYTHLAEHINGITQSYLNLSRRRAEIRAAYRELRSISQSLQAAKDIFHSVESQSDVLGEQPDQLLKLFEKLPHTDMLQSEEIPTTLGIFQRRIGDYLVAYQHMSHNKDQFQAVAEYIGKVDAYLSIAELMANHQDKENSYAWVDFNSSTSTFEAKEMWNPMLEAKQAVTNNITFDTEKNKLLLTGANASGKSVFASSIAINAILAQSFGIAAAKSLELKPFKKILTHIHFKDDINQGLSTMKAELKLIGKILQEASNSNDHMLIIFDDSLFKGTSTSVGEQLAFKSFRRLANDAPEATVIGVTHYDGLVRKVESDATLASHFRLAHMAIRPVDEDLWEPSFKLEFGTPTYNNPLLLLPKDELLSAFGD